MRDYFLTSLRQVPTYYIRKGYFCLPSAVNGKPEMGGGRLTVPRSGHRIYSEIHRSPLWPSPYFYSRPYIRRMALIYYKLSHGRNGHIMCEEKSFYLSMYTSKYSIVYIYTFFRRRTQNSSRSVPHARANLVYGACYGSAMQLFLHPLPRPYMYL